ncbi:MAG: hypothetical protein JWP87_1665 [Labilithrix sp.]|nr:hypothetical protein [Labilithrix sp.]
MRVTESMGPAWETMKRLLFRPFSVGTWFSFGFIFFLQSCMEGGGGNSFNLPTGNHGGSGRGHDGDTGNNLAGLVHDLLGSAGPGLPESGVLVMIVAIAVVVMIPLVILMLWLGTRGQMMAIRAVATGQPAIGEQWNATRDASGKLFKFQLAMTGLGLLVFIPVGGAGLLAAMPVIRDGAGIETVLPVLIGIGLLALIAMIPLLLVNAMARNFVAPIMLKHGLGAREGWKRFWAVGRGHVGGIFVFYLMRLLVSMGAGIVGIIAGFLTCCLGFLPVLHQTLMAPYYVFERAWTLEVLASMSPDFDVRGGGGEPPPPMPYTHGGAGFNPYAGQPGDNPYAPPGYGGGGGGGGAGGGGYGPPPGGFGSP